MTAEPARWRLAGRSAGWRAAMTVAGSLLVGAAACLWLWPWLLSYAVAAVLAAGGLLLLVSAALAKGRGGGGGR